MPLLRIRPVAAIAVAPILGLVAVLAAANVARADPAEEAGSATGACLAAVIDGAPVVDIRGHDVAIHRQGAPNLCSVKVTAGDPQAVRQAVMDAVAARSERFAPAKTPWNAGEFASRETLCSARGRRAFNVLVETGRPGAAVVVSATVLETPVRDDRCDLDYGLQSP